MLRQPVGFSGERFDSREIRTKNGAPHGREIGRPSALWSRFDMRGAADMGVAGGQERPQGVVIDKFDSARGRDPNAERCHGRCVWSRSIPASNHL